MEQTNKFVDFSYCETCKDKDTPEENDPCNECLATPARGDGSRKPVSYKNKDE